MRIGIDALGIHYYGGGRTATLNLFEALFELDTISQYEIFLSQPEPSLAMPAGNVRQRIIPFKNRLLLRFFAQLVLPQAVHAFDLVHFSKNLGVFGISKPTVVTVYDLTTLVHPEFFPRLDVWYWRTIQKQTLSRAKRVIALSQSTAQDILRFYQLPAERVQVIYPACAQQFRPATPDEIKNLRQSYHLPDQFFLHVGRIDQKKNLALLVKAYSEFRKRVPFSGKLVFVGEEYLKSRDKSLVPTIEKLGLKEEVIFTGRVPDRDLPSFYSSALGVVNTSHHEGFGLAPVEAMACGTPLIAYKAGAVGEVVGDAGIIIDCLEVEPFAQALALLAQEPELRLELRDRGLERARQYRRETTAHQTLQLYQELADS